MINSLRPGDKTNMLTHIIIVLDNGLQVHNQAEDKQSH